MNLALKPNPRIKPPVSKTRPWTTAEIVQLRQLANLGARAIAEVLDRPVSAVKIQAYRHRISLRRAGERRGRALGEIAAPAAALVAQLRQVRDDEINHRISMPRMERRIRLILASAPLCPACGTRPIEIRSTGYCQDCHLRALAQAHAWEADAAEAQRELDRERQRKHRRQRGGDE